MKRLVLSFVLLLAATGALAQSHDVLLTPDGTLYTVDVTSSEASAMGGQLYLQVTARQGKTVTTTNVPESMNGLNLRPALAYDDDSKTLFVLWLHRGQNSLSNELNLASYHDGKWQPAVAIDSHASWGEVRLNLRIGMTRRVSQLQKDGTYADAPALLVHAVWWEDNSVDGEGARYALIPIEKGSVGAIDVHALREFADPATTRVEVNDDFNRDFLRHPTMIESPASTTVDVIFGDLRTNTVHRVTLKPVADSRVHIPGGIRGGRPIGAPRALNIDWSGHVTTIDGRDGRTMFVNTTAASVSYITYTNGSWSPVKSVATDDKFTPDAAMAALAKMLASE
jgi:hypothetical protein